MSVTDNTNAGCDKCGTNDRYEDSKCCVACINEEHGIMFDALMSICEVASPMCSCMSENHEDYCLFRMADAALEEIK